MEETRGARERYSSRVGRYFVAALGVAVASGVNTLLAKWGYTGFVPLLFAGVILGAWYGGIGPGLFSTIVATLVASRQFPLSLTHRQEWDDTLRLTIFAACATAASSIHAASRRAELNARIARRNAEESSAAKDRFLAMVSHELKTPLSPILMIIDLLANDSRIPSELHHDLDVVRQSVRLETRLIDDLLDLSRVGNGKMRLDIETVDVRDVIVNATEVLLQDITEKRLRVGSNFISDDCFVLGDQMRLQQVFWNLLRNAVKFTSAGGNIDIRIWRHGNRVLIEISDNGIGIAPGRLEAIFEAFAQENHPVTSCFGGLGLGLAIAKSLVAFHGGAISASSKGKGLGATFRVELPLAITTSRPLTGAHHESMISAATLPSTRQV